MRTSSARESHNNGLLANLITDPADIHDLTSFFAWTAWAAAAERPGHNYSYTNNWPAEPRVDNGPTAQLVVWSALSLIALLGGTGIMFAVYGRWSQKIGWHSAEAPTLSFRQPGEVALTRSQRATIWFFAIISVLFLAQALLGAAAAALPCRLDQFLRPRSGRDPALQPGPHLAPAAGPVLDCPRPSSPAASSSRRSSLDVSRAASTGWPTDCSGPLSWWSWAPWSPRRCPSTGSSRRGRCSPNSGSTSTCPRLWQILLIVGMFLWIAIIYRGMRSRLRGRVQAEHAVAVLLRRPGDSDVLRGRACSPSSDTHLTVADFWRFWVVHLWVEDFLELFTTVMVAYIFVMLGVVSQRIALGVIYLDIILYSAGGVIGTMHHLYFSGTPVEHMALGAFFSAAEVIPLTFLTVEAWAFPAAGLPDRRRVTRKPFPHRWAVMFLVAVGFWNFVGAGIFGFLINLPIVSYYQIGTALTANHGHAAMMGVYGMLAVGLAMFAFRYVIPADKWPEKCGTNVASGALNIGLAWMVFASLLPLGVLQLYHSVNDGYFEARSLGYITQPGNAVLEWMRHARRHHFHRRRHPPVHLDRVGRRCDTSLSEQRRIHRRAARATAVHTNSPAGTPAVNDRRCQVMTARGIASWLMAGYALAAGRRGVGV